MHESLEHSFSYFSSQVGIRAGKFCSICHCPMRILPLAVVSR